MTPTEIGSLAIAALSLLVAGFAAWRTYDLSHRQLRLGSRHEFQKLLLELDKELIRDPELWSVYDNHPMGQVRRDEPAHKAKLEAFAYMWLNVFHIVFVFMAEGAGATDPDQEYFGAFRGTMQDFVCSSSLARDSLARRREAHL